METRSGSTYPSWSGDVNPIESNPNFVREMSEYVMTLSEKNDKVEDKVNKLEVDINGVKESLASLETISRTLQEIRDQTLELIR